MTSNQESQQPNSPRVDLFTEQVLFDTWQIGSHGDIARLSIQFFIGTAVIDIWHSGWSHEHDEWLPKRHLLHLDISAKRLPKLASAPPALRALASNRASSRPAGLLELNSRRKVRTHSTQLIRRFRRRDTCPTLHASQPRALAAARKAGLKVTGIRPDGTLMVRDGDSPQNEIAASIPNGQATDPSRWEDVEA